MKIDLGNLLFDGTFFPRFRRGEQVEHGYKGKGALIHLLVDANGSPILIENTGAKGNERNSTTNMN